MSEVGDQKIIIKTYSGSQDRAMRLYQSDCLKMANKGYFPTSQSWALGRWSGSDFIVALLLCFIFIGFLIFIYMIVVTPNGTLSVTYELRAATAEEKTCPKCAEQIKAAAVLCRFCGHKFPENEILETSLSATSQTPNASELSTKTSRMGAGSIIGIIFLTVCAGIILILSIKQ